MSRLVEWHDDVGPFRLYTVSDGSAVCWIVAADDDAAKENWYLYWEETGEAREDIGAPAAHHATEEEASQATISYDCCDICKRSMLCESWEDRAKPFGDRAKFGVLSCSEH